jgi:hypothetical protein
MGDLEQKVRSEVEGYDAVRLDPTNLITMHDGVRLSTDLYFPADWDGVTPLPCILMRTPYSKANYRPGATATANFLKYHQLLIDFVRAGYVFAIQDKRGKYESEGRYFVNTGDASDGDETLTWLGTQLWSNGRIGMYGCSYSGDVQIVVAPRRNPYLKCIVPQGASGGGRFPYIAFRLGGVIELAMYGGWLRYFGALNRYGPPPGLDREALLALAPYYRSEPVIEPPAHAELKRIWKHLPVIDQMKVWGGPPTGWEDLCSRTLDDPSWKTQFDYVDEDAVIDVPALFENSWYDFGIAETLNMFNRYRRIATPAARPHQHAIISPTCHCESDFASEHTMVGERDVGDARLDWFGLHLAWFDHWLKGSGEKPDLPPLRYYLMGAGEWRDAAAWPPPEAVPTPFYLRSQGQANSRYGDGSLSLEAPGAEPADRYVHDPAAPVPSRGGPLCCTGTPDETEGALDQREIEMRADVLVYSTEPLADDVDVVGPVTVTLFVSSSARDTDFTAKLVDVEPDGTAWNVQEGVLRARYREGFDREVLMEPDGVYELSVDIQATGNRFRRGHRIRLEIASSNFPRFERNLGTGGRNHDETAWVVAVNMIHHDAAHPSRLILPILPKPESLP